MKKNNGVTLITLVITIIVLIILAGVSITYVVGDHGVITKAAEMEEETSKGEVRDRFLLLLNSELLSASADIVGTTDDISTRFNETKLINFLKGNRNYEGKEYAEEDCINCIEEFEGSSDGVEEIKPKDGGDTKIKTKYRVIPDDLCPETDRYGTGKHIADGNIFTLEAVYTEIGDDGTPTGYDGSFELKYYDKEHKEIVLETVKLYMNNQS